MKKSFTTGKFATLFLATILIATTLVESCKFGHVSLQVLKPADIMLPSSFQKFVLADRTRPQKGNGTQALSALEGILTGEGIFQDRWGAQDCVEGLRQELIKTPRYTVTIAAVDTVLKGTGRRQVMPPLDWKTVAKMVGNDTTTGLIVLESFDSNIDLSSALTQAATASAPAAYRADGRVNVYCVWRIYDLKSKTIVDEYTQQFNQTFSGNGATQAAAQSNLPSRDNMTQRAGVAAGNAYAIRISPQWIWVSRNYYKTGSPVLKSTKKLVKYNNWSAATDAWDKEATSSDQKAAMRATYNMALASEQQGQLDLALEWANRAVKMGDKHAMQYVQILQERKAQEERLQQQMKGKTNGN
jgi:hypothetical protein